MEGIDENNKKYVKGIQGQLLSETITDKKADMETNKLVTN